mgnify:CR=1 FL=1
MKKIVLLLAATLVLFALTGCKGSLEIDPNFAPEQSTSIITQ